MNNHYFVFILQFLIVKTCGMIHDFDEFELSSNEIDLLIDESDNLFSVYDDIKTNYDTSIGGSDHLDYYFNVESSATDEELPLPDVKIKLVTSTTHKKYFHFKQTDGFLANQHLPIWTISEKVNKKSIGKRNNSELKSRTGIMERIGKFVMYQNPKKNSAAVYFHQRRQFDGMIDYRYRIQGLILNEVRPVSKATIQLGKSGVISEIPSMAHPRRMTFIDDVVMTKNSEDIIQNTYKNHLYDGYPEVLVIVSYELAHKFFERETKCEKYTSIISYILTLFNGVDMLYSKLKQTNIKINIAGIIIASKHNSLSFLDNCYKYYYDTKWLSTDCAIDKIRKYLYTRRKIIPLDFYDVTVFLTEHKLFTVENGEAQELSGRSGHVPIYDTKMKQQEPLQVAIINDDGSFKSYVSITHEIAHTMNILHDKGPFVTKEGSCCGHIMKTESNWCRSCLSWSESSELEFKNFFSSADCCIFVNKPRSLNPPGRQIMLTANEQCQIYGYESAKIFEGSPTEFCESSLQCRNDIGEFHQTVIPMLGTPCDTNKICWEKMCVEIT